jgi:hypothetical protein
MWGRDAVSDLGKMVNVKGGLDELITIVSRGKQDKPQSYADGVQVWVDKLQLLRNLRGHG